jgi:hypothetical protein
MVRMIHEVLNKAQTWLELEIGRIAYLEGLERKDTLREVFEAAVDRDEIELLGFRTSMSKIGIKGQVFNSLLKAARNHCEKQNQNEDIPQILGDDVPLLSPALGFQRDIAMVTVPLVEHTKDNKLNTQPYLVTSSRELRR